MHPRVLLAAVLTAVLALGALVVVAATSARDETAPGPSGFAGAVRPAIPPQDFSLRDEEGRPLSLGALRGRVVALAFLYTTCEDACPTIAAQVGAALDDVPGEVAAVAVSVDPANDTPERAQRFLVERGLRGRMRFALGTRAELAPVWRAYGIQPQGDDLEHSTHVVLIDAQGRQRVGYPFDKLTPQGLAHDIRVLQAEAA